MKRNEHPTIKIDLGPFDREERARLIANHYSRARARANGLVDSAFGESPVDVRLNLALIHKPEPVSRLGNAWREVTEVKRRGTFLKLHLSCGHIIQRKMKGREYKGEYQSDAMCHECMKGNADVSAR